MKKPELSIGGSDFTFLTALWVKSKLHRIGANNIILTFIYFNNDFRFLYRIMINF